MELHPELEPAKVRTSGAIGFVGTGRMGTPMALRLLQSDAELLVHNRSRAHSEQLVRRGAQICESLGEMGRRADIVVLMLPDTPTVESVVTGAGGLLESLRAGSLIVDMGSTAPATSVLIARACRQAQVSFVDAPVSGSVRAAEGGDLTVMIGGAKADVRRALPVVSLLGKNLFHMGNNGAGCKMKLAVNIMLALSATALAEALSFGTEAGLAPNDVLEVLLATPSSSLMMQRKGAAMVAGDFTPAAPMHLLEKDLTQALEAAAQTGLALPVTRTARDQFRAGRARGMADLDFAAVYQLVRKSARKVEG